MGKLQLPADICAGRTKRHVDQLFRLLFGMEPDPPKPKTVGRILTEEHGLALTDEMDRELIY